MNSFDKARRFSFVLMLTVFVLFMAVGAIVWSEESSFFPHQTGSVKMGGACSNQPSKGCHELATDEKDLVSEPDEGLTPGECADTCPESTESTQETITSDDSCSSKTKIGILIVYCPVAWHCSACEATKKYLKEKGIAFESRDSDKNQDIVSKYGRKAVPVFYYNGQYYPYHAYAGHSGWPQLRALLNSGSASSSTTAYS